MCLPNYRRGDGVFLIPSPDTEPPNTHTPDIPAEGEWQGWPSMWGCMWLVIMGFSPRRASHRRISTRKQCRKTDTHKHPLWMHTRPLTAVIESVSICVSLVAMNECLTWIPHATWWMSSMQLKNACFVYMLVHRLAVSYKPCIDSNI